MLENCLGSTTSLQQWRIHAYMYMYYDWDRLLTGVDISSLYFTFQQSARTSNRITFYNITCDRLYFSLNLKVAFCRTINRPTVACSSSWLCSAYLEVKVYNHMYHIMYHTVELQTNWPYSALHKKCIILFSTASGISLCSIKCSKELFMWSLSDWLLMNFCEILVYYYYIVVSYM